jgi:uncharacterized protein (DUF2252 family)
MPDDLPPSSRRTREQRTEQGRSYRQVLPRSEHARWSPDSNRPSVVDLLRKSNEDRLATLVPIRHGRMLASPLAYFRGMASSMAYDLGHMASTEMTVQSCGDCHLQNFGWFGTPERNIVFDVNDFDETMTAPWEWDLKRLAVSFALAASVIGAPKQLSKAIATTVAREYRDQLAIYNMYSPLARCYQKLDSTAIASHFVEPDTTMRLKKMFDKARQHTMETLLPKLAVRVGNELKIVDQPPLIYHSPQSDGYFREVGRLLLGYRNSLTSDRRFLLDFYELSDAAYKVVGVGSIGLRCGLVLLEDADNSPLLLQMKEARASVLAPYAGQVPRSNHGERIVCGQRLLQAASDIFLGWTIDSEGRHYYVRQLRDMKMSVDVTKFSQPELADYARLCGWALARAHSKAGDPAYSLGYIGTSERFENAIGEFAVAYSEQVNRDFGEFQIAAKNGLVPVESKTK